MSYPGDSQWIFPQDGLEASAPHSDPTHEPTLANAFSDLQAALNIPANNFSIDPTLLTLQPNPVFQPDIAHSYDDAPSNAFIQYSDDLAEAENVRRQIQEFLDFCSQGSQAGPCAQDETLQAPIQPMVEEPLNQPDAMVDLGFPSYNSWSYPTDVPALPFPFTYGPPTEQVAVPQPYPPQNYAPSVAVGQVLPQWQIPNYGPAPSIEPMALNDSTPNNASVFLPPVDESQTEPSQTYGPSVAAGQVLPQWQIPNYDPAPSTDPMTLNNPTPNTASVFLPPLEQSQTEPWKKPVHTLPTKRPQRRLPYSRPDPLDGVAATHNIDEFFACRWETPGSCPHNIGVLKTDVREHLKDYHFPHLKGAVHVSAAWQEVVQCRWHVGDTSADGSGLCGALVKLGSLGNHITGVHTRSVEHICLYCYRDFSRRDAAKRHEFVRRKNGHCPESTGKKKKAPNAAARE